MPHSPPAPEPAPGSLDISTQIRIARTVLLFRQPYLALVLGIGLAGVLCLLLREAVPAVHLLTWLACVTAASMGRLIVFMGFHRSLPNGPQVLAWERPYCVSLLVSAFTWGLGVALLLPEGDALHQAEIFAFLVGMSGGSISFYSAHRPLMLATQSCLLLPLTGRLLLQGDLQSLALALGAVLFFLASVRSTRVMADAYKDSTRLSMELQEAKQVAEALARIDPLTGLHNRRALEEFGSMLAKTRARQGKPITALVLDLDHFKTVNDTHGHATGDRALEHIASIMRGSLRSSDVCGRLGGEEFGILVAADYEEACTLGHKLRLRIATCPLPTEAGPIHLTTSIGVASGLESPEILFQRADEALYRAKKAGRNCVVCDHCPGDAEDVRRGYCARFS